MQLGPNEKHLPVETSGARTGAPPRPRHLTITPVILGVIFGSCLSALNVILAFKVGTGFGGAIVTVLLGGAALRLLRKLNWRTLFLTYAIASGGTLAVTAIDTSIGAGLLGGAPPPSWIFLIGVGLLANLLGLLLGIALAPSIINDHSLKYPALWPVIDLMHALTGSGDREAGVKEQRLILVGAVVAAGLSFAAAFVGRDSLPLAPGVSPYLALSLSPMLFGLGMRISGSATVWIGVGAVYSLIVWSANVLWGSPQPGAAYIEHLGSPWILAVGVGLLLGYACGFLAKLVGGKRSVVTGAIHGRSVRWWVAAAGGAAVMAGCVVALSHWLPLIYMMTALIFAVLAPLFAVLMNRVNAAIGIAPTGVFQYLTLVILALLHVPAGPAYLLIALICCSALASAYFIEAAKVASTAPAPDAPRTRQLFTYQVIGSVAGVGTGITLLFLVSELGNIGTAAFPAPTSTALDFLNSLLRGSQDYAQSTTVFLATAGLAGMALAWSPALLTMLGLGVLLPAATSIAILLGSVTKMATQRHRRDQGAFASTLGSGLILGGGMANALLLPIQVLTS